MELPFLFYEEVYTAYISNSISNRYYSRLLCNL